MAVLNNAGIRAGATAAAAAGPGYTIKRSARFNESDNAHLSWTPAAAGNRSTWTWSGWVKRCDYGTQKQGLFGVAGSNVFIRFNNDDGGSNLRVLDAGNYDVITTRKFRDTSAWYHIVVILDTTEEQDSDRIKIYVNNVRETDWYGTPTWPGEDDEETINTAVGHVIGVANSDYYDGSLADIYFIDGSAKAPTEFAQTNATTGQWVPKEYSGSYGTNGFHLAMDPANGGANYSQYGATVGINPSYPWSKAFDGITDGTYGNGAGAVDGAGWIKWEPTSAITVSSSLRLNTDNGTPAIKVNGSAKTTSDGWTTISGISSLSSIEIYNSGSDWTYLCGVEVDGNLLVDHTAIGYDSSGNKNHWHENNIFGSEHTVGNENFKVVTYDGTGSSQTVNCGFQPDFVWIKAHDSGSYGHRLVDSVRGISKYLMSHSTAGEGTEAQGITAITSTGFTVGTNGDFNLDTLKFVAWCWKAGGAASALNTGSIDASVSANTAAGFSIVSYEGTGPSSSGTVAHGLGKKPDMIIAKSRDATTNWYVWHSASVDNINTKYALLNSSAAVNPAAGDLFTTVGTTTFGVEAGSNTNNQDSMIAYCWTGIDGYSKFGSIAGGSDPVIDCGFAPAFLMVKRTDSAGHWYVFDKARGANPDNQTWLEANNAGAQQNHANGLIKWLPNGFQLKGGDVDVSGNLIYAAFAGHPEGDLDLLADVPGAPYDNSLNGGGNYCTLNPLQPTFATTTLSNGNLDASIKFTNGTVTPYVVGNFSVSSGKWYYEITITQKSNDTEYIGWMEGSHSSGAWAFAYIAAYFSDARKAVAGSPASYGASYGTGDIIGCALDATNGNVTFYKNGVSQGAAATGMTFDSYKPFISCNGTSTEQLTSCNFGQRPFAYTPPTDYKALNTYNLTDPTITKGNTGFDTKIYDGNNGTQTITGLEFSPDLVWIKDKSAVSSHWWYDTVRGTQKLISSNYDGQENWAGGGSAAGEISAFTSDGFTIVNSGSYGGNASGSSFVAWNWDAGSAGSNTTNDASSTGVGTIDSEYRVNTATGFSVVTFTNTTSDSSVAHGLNAKPDMIIWKKRNGTSHWPVYHSAIGATKYLYLNLGNAAATGSEFWNNTEPTSSVITTKGEPDSMGSAGDTVMYVFSGVSGYSKFGSYEGNNSTDGSFVYLGFKPALIIVKNIDVGSTNWEMWDNKRPGYNLTDLEIRPNQSNAEYESSANCLDILSNGFKFRGNDSQSNSAATFVYAAWAVSPFKYNNAH